MIFVFTWLAQNDLLARRPLISSCCRHLISSHRTRPRGWQDRCRCQSHSKSAQQHCSDRAHIWLGSCCCCKKTRDLGELGDHFACADCGDGGSCSRSSLVECKQVKAYEDGIREILPQSFISFNCHWRTLFSLFRPALPPGASPLAVIDSPVTLPWATIANTKRAL